MAIPQDEQLWDDDPTCRKCHGEGDVPAHKMGVITPLSETSDRHGDFYICPRCGGTGIEH